ncbi:hypothetical protein AVO45_00430 [Ruegeria marisrubri]|uniref:MEMO1 family protein n=1 Tax=Ruegeria marisrubri TaxID=1685379 RepID=A0A0X3UCB1_9RHOB|nr:hypothetical protein AVO45_00430 [Ruegeria marisrubri]
MIAPHAGYVYSGAIAAEAFGCLRDSLHRFRRAVVIGPSHYVRFTGLAAPSQGAFATPMGLVPIDREAIEALVSEGLAAIDDAPHGPDHAVEVELPFLQAVFGAMAIVPLLFGETSAAHVANAIRRLWDDDTLLVVSSDLSHYEPYDLATAHDTRTATAIEGFDQAAIGPFEACGHMAIRGMLLEAQDRGYSIERLDLRNSGDTSGDRQRVVGYGAWAIGQLEPSN